jgi:hypothetical protein
MGRRVVVIASGETERRSLPILVDHLKAHDVSLLEVRIPPGGNTLHVDMAAKLIKASWFEQFADPPEKFVVLVDADGKDPDEVLRPFQLGVQGKLGPKITAAICFAIAQWHLEAWFFADASGLRRYLERDLGNVDPSKPDQIQLPKHHLKRLLGGLAYTAVVAGQIAESMDPLVIEQRSPSFRTLLEGMPNGLSPS